MPCFHPIPAYRSESGEVKFWPKVGFSDEFCVPCGRCVGCLLERSRQWAVRLMHESQLWDESCFITLTYDDEHMPEHGALNLRDFQLFMKRLRKSLRSDAIAFYGLGKKPAKQWSAEERIAVALRSRVAFFHCGEYGDENFRPHYHAIVFGWKPVDGVVINRRNGSSVYYSAVLERLWESRGLCSFGDVTFQSCAYVARYCLKKRPSGLTEDACPSVYGRLDVETGEIVEVPREYCTMSRRPAIADRWFEQFMSDVYPGDEVAINGTLQRPPRFYDRRLKRVDASLLEQLKKARVDRAIDHYAENTPERLKVRETVCKARSKSLVRSI